MFLKFRSAIFYFLKFDSIFAPKTLLGGVSQGFVVIDNYLIILKI